jgi:mevalonate kinase
MADKIFHSSAPNKVHLAGEHSVVYGGWALMAPIEVEGKRNLVELKASDCAAGSETVTITLSDGRCVMDADGTLSGTSQYLPLFEAVKIPLKKHGYSLNGGGVKLDYQITYSGSPKGTGNSASIPAAIAAATYVFVGVNPSKKDLFDASYAVDNLYHAGKSSGGDCHGVVSDSPQTFRKIFSPSGASFEYRDANLRLPAGSCLLLVDSYRQGQRANTGELINQFAKFHGVSKAPGQLSESERQRITAPFDRLVQQMLAEFTDSGSPLKLAALMDENHSLLEQAGVTSPDIQGCIALAKDAGALGGKLIGAGGIGGGVLLLCPIHEAPAVESALKRKGFATYPITFSNRGAGLD